MGHRRKWMDVRDKRDSNMTIIIISFILLSYVLFMCLQPSIFVQAQNLANINQTNNSRLQFYIPPTISKEAQEILKNLTMNMSTFVIPRSDDLEGWQKLNQQISSLFVQLSQPIVDSYQPNITLINPINPT
jgi:hypothetical protein